MKKLFLSFSFLAVAIGFTACKKSSNSPSNTAYVMFVNAATGTTSVSVTANGVAVPGASNVAFTKNTGYNSITAGTSVPISFSAIGSGISTPLVSGTASLAVNADYTVFAGGLFTAPSYVMTSDDLSVPATGNVKIRFVNLSADNLNASCFVGNTKLDSNIAYKSYTPFIQISATTDKITMLDPIAPTNTAQLLNQTLSAGKIYTVILTGSSAGTGVAALGLTLINNN